MNYLMPAGFIGIVLFFAYRFYLQMQSDRIVADAKIKLDDQKRAEYEKQDQALEEEIKHDQVNYDHPESGPSGKPSKS